MDGVVFNRRVFAAMCAVAISSLAHSQRPRSPELQVLDQFTGRWNVQLTVVPTAGTGKKEHKFESVVNWSAGRNYLLINELFVRERLITLTYDLVSAKYVGFMFNDAERSTITGQWNDEKKCMTLDVEQSKGMTAQLVYTRESKDRFLIAGLVRDKNGKQVISMAGTQTRKMDANGEADAGDLKEAVEFRLAAEQPITGWKKLDAPNGDKEIYVSPDVILTGSEIKSINVGKDDFGHPQLQFSFKAEGAAKLGRATQANVGKTLAVLLNEEIVCAPKILVKVTDAAVLSGNFTKEQLSQIEAAFKN